MSKLKAATCHKSTAYTEHAVLPALQKAWGQRRMEHEALSIHLHQLLLQLLDLRYVELTEQVRNEAWRGWSQAILPRCGCLVVQRGFDQATMLKAIDQGFSIVVGLSSDSVITELEAI